MTVWAIWLSVFIAILAVSFAVRIIVSFYHNRGKRILTSDEIEDRCLNTILIIFLASLFISVFVANGGRPILERTVESEYLLKNAMGRYQIVSQETFNFVSATRDLGMLAILLLVGRVLIRRLRQVLKELTEGTSKIWNAFTK